MHAGVAVISKEKLDSETKMTEYFDQHDLYDRFDYFTIGGGWSNTFNKTVKSDRFTEDIDNSVLQIKEDNLEDIKKSLDENVYYIVFNGNVIPRERFIDNENYKPETRSSGFNLRDRIKEIRSLPIEEQEKIKPESYELYISIDEKDFYNFLNDELKNHIGSFITILDIHE